MNQLPSGWRGLVTLFLTSALHVSAQTVIGASGLGNAGTGNAASIPGTQTTPISSVAAAIARPAPLWQSGAVSIRPHIGYEVVYGTGILRIPGHEEKTTLQTVSPGILIEVGKRTTFDYTLLQKYYSGSGLSDATDHTAQIQTKVILDEWNAGVSGSYNSSTDVLVETGGQTYQENYGMSVDVSRQVGRRSELEMNLTYSDRVARPVEKTAAWEGSGYTLWNALVRLRYHISKSLSVAPGIGGGYDQIKDRPDMSRVEPSVQITWSPAPKLSLNAEAGATRLKTHATGGRTQNNGRYSAAGHYSPFEATTFSVEASRSINPSYFHDQTSLTNSVSLSVQQRLFRRLFLSAVVSRGQTDYESTTTQDFIARDDQYNSFNLRLSTTILRKFSLAAYYQRSRNRSSEAIYQFSSDQVGGMASYRF